ncbi:heme peroxidase [Lyophyllum atratum]|nr:heme peroxidase [Lyophyllum atratum]
MALQSLGAGIAQGAATLNWPDPRLDFAENTLYVGNTLPNLTKGCAQRANTTIAAQWVRIAYHDMSTHDATDGSGGLDASILFELDRPQNVGIGMTQSLTDFNFFTTPYVGLADTIAMGTVFAVASCGGPVIPFRAGRKDATAAGPATVPEPQESLESHIASFRRQGFTQEEMIALVACGHTFGGVRRDDFPEIVDGDAKDGFANFDGTPFSFDNSVVTEYLQDTTTNALVSGANVTTRSDLRIFSSDGNSTMENIASPNNFSKTCGALLERMINTVPKDVTLTEVIDPLENKRLIANPSRTVTLYWKERQTQGSLCPSNGCFAPSAGSTSRNPTFLAELRGIQSFEIHHFSAQIPLNASISKFWFEVDEKDGSPPTIVENGGSGFEIDQDTVLFDPARTTIVSLGFDAIFMVAVGVSCPRGRPLSVESFQPGTPTFLPKIETVILQPDENHPPSDGYTFFTGNISTSVTSMHIKAVIGGKTFTQYVVSDDFLA